MEQWIVEARARYLSAAESFLRERRLLRPGESLNSLGARWPEYVRDYCQPGRETEFYHQWLGSVGAANIVANIVDQFSRGYVVAALNLFFAPPYGFTGVILDYGCGTAALSLNWQRSFAPKARLCLADLENLPREFVRHEAAQQPHKVEFHGVDLEGIEDRSVDLMLCIDVLEHLTHPSDTFRLLSRKLRSGGILLLQAPWGGHPEHLDEAPKDWEANGGQALLDRDYNLLSEMNPGALSGVYGKRMVD